MSEHSDSSMIAFLPDEASWVQQKLPHLTLVYAGPIAEAGSSLKRDLLLETSLLAAFVPRLWLPVLGVDQFGDDVDRVDVLRLLRTVPLDVARRMVESYSKSQHKTYNPHVTIGPVGSANQVDLPKGVFFSRVMLSWGDDHVVFDLRG